MTATADLKTGTLVTFKGGTGRDDADKFLPGVVNGELVETPEGMVYVPVYVSDTDQCVMVALDNITEVV